jgi:predicted RNase H-like HicB family nuclease
MTYTVIVHEAEEGGFWSEVAGLPGCLSQGETLDELEKNTIESIVAWLSAHVEGRGEHRPERIRRWELTLPDDTGLVKAG